MGSAAQAAEKTVVVLGTATPGGGFPVYGAAVADTVNEVDPTLALTPQNTKGSTENVPLLEAGRLDVALVQGEVVHEALGGIGRPPAKLKLLAAVAGGPGGARFLAPAADERARILAKHAFLKPLTVPAGAYAGLDAPLASVGSWSFILTRADLPDDLAYRLARALHRGEAQLGQRLPQARETTAANTLAAAPRREQIHPGVLRYLREVG